jgi:hypothetical protein
MKDKKFILLSIAGLLVLIGLIKPDFNKFFPSSPDTVSVETNNFVKPSEDLKDESDAIINALSVDKDRKLDGKRLASLAGDMATLIELDNENEVIKNTEEIRQANSLIGPMLKLNISGKYPDLKTASQNMIVSVIGDDNVALNKDLREKAVIAFKTLAWSYYEGSK